MFIDEQLTQRFVAKVAEMRRCQRQFFETSGLLMSSKAGADLRDAKRLEREVDEMLDMIQGRQPSLYQG